MITISPMTHTTNFSSRSFMLQSSALERTPQVEPDQARQVRGLVAHQEIVRIGVIARQEIQVKDCTEQDHGDNAPIGLIVIARYFVRIARPV